MLATNWDFFYSSNSSKSTILECSSDIRLYQFINVPTHVDGKTLDIIFAIPDKLSFSIENIDILDQFPLPFNLLYKNLLIHILKEIFQSLRFPPLFSKIILVLLFGFSTLCLPPANELTSNWYSSLLHVLSISADSKSRKRLDNSYYYSCHTMHLFNCRNTNYRKLQKHWFLFLSIKHRDLNRQSSESIELEKCLLVDEVNLSYSKHCF